MKISSSTRKAMAGVVREYHTKVPFSLGFKISLFRGTGYKSIWLTFM